MNAENHFDSSGCVEQRHESTQRFICVHLRYICVHLRFQILSLASLPGRSQPHVVVDGERGVVGEALADVDAGV
ncbi:MAG: hypothetical protein ACXWGX_15940, partial [Usitatibacter sp.]